MSSGRPVTNREFAARQAAVPGAQLDLLPGRERGGSGDPYLDITRLTADTPVIVAYESGFVPVR